MFVLQNHTFNIFFNTTTYTYFLNTTVFIHFVSTNEKLDPQGELGERAALGQEDGPTRLGSFFRGVEMAHGLLQMVSCRIVYIFIFGYVSKKQQQDEAHEPECRHVFGETGI